MNTFTSKIDRKIRIFSLGWKSNILIKKRVHMNMSICAAALNHFKVFQTSVSLYMQLTFLARSAQTTADYL